jgi:hypothetical protein
VQSNKQDDALPAELRNLVRSWRELYRADEEHPTDGRTRNALEKLAAVDDSGAVLAVRALNPRTEALLEAAALKAYRRKQPRAASVPAARLDPSFWSATDIRSFAAQALKDLPRSLGGRPRARHEEFMRALMHRWHWSLGKVGKDQLPLADAVQDFRSFARFARTMFNHVGVNLSDVQLRAIRAQVLSKTKR